MGGFGSRRCGRRVGIAVVLSVLCGALSAAAAPAAPGGAGTTFDPASKGFGVKMTIELKRQWHVLPADPAGPPVSKAFGLVHVGVPASDDSQWWGPDIVIVDGARVHRPSDVVSATPAKPDPAAFVPWPASFYGYLSALPGVKVLERPKAVTVGGVRGTQFTLRTPSMHPVLWLQGDTAWIGGGPTGVDPPLMRRVIELNVQGKRLLIAYADTPASFARRWPAMWALLSSIRF